MFFGFSLAKLLVLAAIIATVWYGFKFFGRLDANRKAQLKATVTGRPRPPPADDGPSETMIECAVCGVFVTVDATGNCGREDCPY